MESAASLSGVTSTLLAVVDGYCGILFPVGVSSTVSAVEDAESVTVSTILSMSS